MYKLAQHSMQQLCQCRAQFICYLRKWPRIFCRKKRKNYRYKQNAVVTDDAFADHQGALMWRRRLSRSHHWVNDCSAVGESRAGITSSPEASNDVKWTLWPCYSICGPNWSPVFCVDSNVTSRRWLHAAARMNRVIRNLTWLEASLPEFDSRTNTLVDNKATAMITARVCR